METITPIKFMKKKTINSFEFSKFPKYFPTIAYIIFKSKISSVFRKIFASTKQFYSYLTKIVWRFFPKKASTFLKNPLFFKNILHVSKKHLCRFLRISFTFTFLMIPRSPFHDQISSFWKKKLTKKNFYFSKKLVFCSKKPLQKDLWFF